MRNSVCRVLQDNIKCVSVSNSSGAMRFGAIVLVTSALLLVGIIFFPAPFHRISMNHATHLAEDAFNQRFDNVTEFRLNYVRFEKKVWKVGISGKGYRDGEFYGETIAVSVDPVTGHAQIGVVVGVRISDFQEPIPFNVSWISVIEVLALNPDIQVIKISSDNFTTIPSVFEAIDRALFEEISPRKNPFAAFRRRKIPLNEAEKIVEFFGEEILEEKKNYEYYVNYVNKVFAILIQFYPLQVSS